MKRQRASAALFLISIAPMAIAAPVSPARISPAERTADTIRVAVVKPAADSPRGDVVLTTSSGSKVVGRDAWKAWLIDGAVVYSRPGIGAGFEGEGMDLYRYDRATGKTTRIHSESLQIEQVLAARARSGRDVLLVSLRDGGVGNSSAAIVDPRGGVLWRHTSTSLSPVRAGVVAQRHYAPGEGPESARLLDTRTIGIDALLTGPSVYSLNHNSGGMGKYAVASGAGDPQSSEPKDVHVILSRTGAAEIRVDLGGDGFLVNGTWRSLGGDGIAIRIERGLDDAPLTGRAFLLLRNGHEWERLDMGFTHSSQKTSHRLLFTAAKG